MIKIAIYARCSTLEQFVDNQLEVLRSYATERGLEVVAEYSENKSGWKDGHQLELANLVAEAKRRKFNAVLTWSLDRLSRGGPAWHAPTKDTTSYVRVKDSLASGAGGR